MTELSVSTKLLRARSTPNLGRTRSDKYYLVTAGSVRFVLEDQIADLDAGDFCLVPQGKRFSYSNVGSSLAVLALVHTPSFELNAEVFEV